MQLKNAVIKRIIAEVIPYLPEKVKHAVLQLDKSIMQEIEEIRLRAGKPVILSCFMKDLFLSEGGLVFSDPNKGFITTINELTEMVFKICENSWYAYQDDINKGFITIKGGHRIGLVGTPVVVDDKIINMRDISSLNIRIAREVLGCGDQIVEHIINGCRDVFNTLIISPPGLGKTTLLRDIIRIISSGFGKDFAGIKVGVVDERGEIAACYRGIAQNDLGYRTDVINGIHKKDGMEILLRSMSPNVISLDELGNPEDVSTVLQVINAGIRVIATAHGYSLNDVKQRRGFRELFSENCFERIIIISSSNEFEYEVKVMDGEENVIAVDCENRGELDGYNKLNHGGICIFPSPYYENRIHTGNTVIINGAGK
jgi:stage III sporulation protein AA